MRLVWRCTDLIICILNLQPKFSTQDWGHAEHAVHML